MKLKQWQAQSISHYFIKKIFNCFCTENFPVKAISISKRVRTKVKHSNYYLMFTYLLRPGESCPGKKTLYKGKLL